MGMSPGALVWDAAVVPKARLQCVCEAHCLEAKPEAALHFLMFQSHSLSCLKMGVLIIAKHLLVDIHSLAEKCMLCI